MSPSLGYRAGIKSAWLTILVFAALGVVPAHAGFPQCPNIGYSAGCAILIEIRQNGSLRFHTDPSVPPYDNIEDTLVGVLNNSGATVFGISLTGGGIFGFDFDGAGDPTGSFWASGSPYGAFPGGPFGPTGYEGPGTSFTLEDANTGTVNFTNGLANGQSLWFSLEGAPTEVRLSHSIAIDPGHGSDCNFLWGTSDGAVGPTYGDTEANLALVIGEEVSALATARGYRVVLTRTTDDCPSIQQRWRTANDEKVNAFVSIHFNAAGSPTPNGSEVWYYPPKTDSLTLASDVLAQVITDLPLGNRGVKRSGTDAPWSGRNIGVLVGTKMTAVLVEVAFLTNPSDEALMHDLASQILAATAIFDGTDAFFNP